MKHQSHWEQLTFKKPTNTQRKIGVPLLLLHPCVEFTAVQAATCKLHLSSTRLFTVCSFHSCRPSWDFLRGKWGLSVSWTKCWAFQSDLCLRGVESVSNNTQDILRMCGNPTITAQYLHRVCSPPQRHFLRGASYSSSWRLPQGGWSERRLIGQDTAYSLEQKHIHLFSPVLSRHIPVALPREARRSQLCHNYVQLF